MESNSIQRVDLIFISTSTEKVIEKWSCGITYPTKSSKNEDVSKQIHALLRQIQNTVAFLPLISNQICKFDLLVHCKRTASLENIWEGIGLGVIPYEYTTDMLRSISSSVSYLKEYSFFINYFKKLKKLNRIFPWQFLYHILMINFIQ